VTYNSGAGGPLLPGLNFRIDPTTGALVQADTDINPPTARVQGIAYTNNGLAPTATSLYTITATTIYIQNPQNSGTQTQGVTLSKELGLIAGFDLDEGASTTVSGAPVTAGSSEAYVLGTDGTLMIGIYRTTCSPVRWDRASSSAAVDWPCNPIRRLATCPRSP
jgi:hypothetical protein